ncbi:MAG: UMP kinase [Candidatus Freyarchaeota archaeon]
MRVVIRIGGSVLASPPNPKLMAKYADLLRSLKAKGHEFVVVVGGGSVARDFIELAEELGLSEPEKDEVAILVSRIFARLLARKLGDLSHEEVPTSVEAAAEALESGKIVMMGGLRPGMTTDAVAALVAEAIEADLLVKATNQDGIYDRDPKKHPDAKKIDRLSFRNLFQLFEEDRHRAGIHQILDPEAVRILQQRKTKTVVVNGFHPENVALAMEGKRVGTLIQE